MSHAVIRCIVQRYARHQCIKRMVRKVRKYGKVMICVTVKWSPDWTAPAGEYDERRAVEDAIREERGE